MDIILNKLTNQFPDLSFVAGNRFSWSPKKQQVIYKEDSDINDPVTMWSLLHELGHALLTHNDFTTDFELLQLESAAWIKAQELATDFDQEIDNEHIEDCLDTYRDWLYQRSTCPTCTSTSLQTDRNTYNCFNCGTFWQVSNSRLCRAYRRTSAQKALV